MLRILSVRQQFVSRWEACVSTLNDDRNAWLQDPCLGYTTSLLQSLYGFVLLLSSQFKNVQSVSKLSSSDFVLVSQPVTA